MLFSSTFKSRFEILTLYFGISTFIIHASIIFLLKLGWLDPQYFPKNLFGNPFSALFSPFSSLLVYEVYLLIYYLRKSYTKSISKQLEIMALILLRNCFKDAGGLTEGTNLLMSSELIKDLSGFIILMLLVWLFHRIDASRVDHKFQLSERFVALKDKMATVLMIIFFGLSIFSFSDWLLDLIRFSSNHQELENPSHVFYREFFTLLTFADVILLLSSAKNLQNTILIIRNSGYVLATFLLRISFSLEGWERISILIMGASMAVFMLWISRRRVFLEVQEE
ncbi:MAG: hypothetical protein FJY06_02290 [Bacteroidetes bacterium]|nr:hypothetical protein [Bacteroidota bacterium]